MMFDIIENREDFKVRNQNISAVERVNQTTDLMTLELRKISENLIPMFKISLGFKLYECRYPYQAGAGGAPLKKSSPKKLKLSLPFVLLHFCVS